MKLFQSSATGLSIIQWCAMLSAVAGVFYFDFNLTAILTATVTYFLYAGVGISMMFHRYYTHRSFEMNKSLANVLTWFGVLAGRGSPMGWVYVHRDHHKNSDIEGKDPHRPDGYKWWWVFFPHKMMYGKKMNLRLIKDMIRDPYQIHLGNYYNLYIVVWVALLFVIDPWLAYFAWVIPVSLTNIAFNTFHHTGHGHGYRLSENEKSGNSTNTWIHGYFLFGEGWHNTHHAHPRRWNFGEKWWEFDPVALFIRNVKQ